jgi:hypothetical protein
MRSLLAAVFMGILLSACTIPGEPAMEAPGPNQPLPGPCTNRDLEWDYQRSEILRLNKGYAYIEIIPRAAFVNQFNALPPTSDWPVPDVAGYFAKPDDTLAIVAFANAGCVVYLEVVNFENLQVILRRLGN